MLSTRNILLLIAVFLSAGGSLAIASDENPWSMDEPGQEQQPYYDLNGGGAGGPVEPRLPVIGKRANEITVRKSLPYGKPFGWQSAPGKEHRDEIYGYAGPQPSRVQSNTGPTDETRFGAFPTVSGTGGRTETGGRIGARQQYGTPATKSGGVRYKGKSFGAFPPIGSRAGQKKQPQQSPPRIQRNAPVGQKQATRAFSNRLPSPIPEPAPERILPYPYVGYGAPLGYGTQYGTGLAAPGMGMPGLGYGSGRAPAFSNPGIPPGVFGPGFMW